MRSGVWMSASEVNGDAVNSLSLTTDFSAAAALLLMLVLRQSLQAVCSPRVLLLIAGMFGFAGSLLIVLTGPYYGPVVFAALGNPKWLLTVSGVLCGVSLGMLYLVIGVRYCMLSFRYAILYLCYSNVLGVVIYLAVMASPAWTLVEGGPTFASVAAFAVLPLCSAAFTALCFNPMLWASCCMPADSAMGKDAVRCASLEAQAPSRRFLRLYSKLLFVLTLFALVCGGVTFIVVGNARPSLLQSQYNLLMLLRLPLLLVVVVAVTSVDAA